MKIGSKSSFYPVKNQNYTTQQQRMINISLIPAQDHKVKSSIIPNKEIEENFCACKSKQAKRANSIQNIAVRNDLVILVDVEMSRLWLDSVILEVFLS